MVLPDIVGSNAVVNIGLLANAQGITRLTARWISFVVTGGGQVRLTNGDQVPTASFGIPIGSPYGGQFAPPVSQGDNPPPYHLNAWNAYVPAGATLTVSYEPFN